jgi:RNA polymerase sigma factor (sigma-70 family)
MLPGDDLAAKFELERPRLRAVATGILGSRHEAEDAVQEAWFRLDRVDHSTISNLSAWLTVVVSRIALDQIRARTSRREVTIDSPVAAGLAADGSGETSVIFEESVYEALAHALDRLSPLESATFILHDLFRLPFDEISAIIERSPEATRKLASRARQKIAVEDVPRLNPEPSHRAIVEAFLHAARSGEMDRLIGLLAPNAVLHADPATAEMGVQPEIVGAAGVAGRFAGGARVVHLAWLDGEPGAAWIHRGDVRVAFDFAIRDGRIQEIWLRSDRDYLDSTEIEIEIAPLPRWADQEFDEN